MIIKEIKGDIIEEFKNGNIDVLVHGCNCFHTMGAGLAKQVKEEFPFAYKVDLKTPCGDINKLGNFSKIDITPNILDNYKGTITRAIKTKAIINAYTQFYPGRNFEYSAFIQFLKTLNLTHKYMGTRVGFPKIGCGIGGGEWGYVKTLIEKYLPNMKVIIVEYDSRIERLGQAEIDFESSSS